MEVLKSVVIGADYRTAGEDAANIIALKSGYLL